MTAHPDTPYPKRGEPNAELLALDGLAKPLQRLAQDAASLIEKHSLDSAEITIGDGTIVLKKSSKNGLSIKLHGSLAAESLPSGAPYYAHYTGEFFWRPSPDSDDFVKSGDTVRSGQLVGWAMGESKDMSFGLRADQDGVIHLVANNATKVKQNETLLYYIEGKE